MTAAFPAIVDWDRFALDAAPSVSRAGDGSAMLLGLAVPASTIDAQVQSVAEGLSDLDLASGYLLDVAGSRVTVARGGLPDVEYRRLIAGARAAVGSRGTVADVWAGWLALTGASAADAEMRRIGVAGDVSVTLSARLAFMPSAGWRRAAGGIVGRLIAAGVQWRAVVYLSGVARYDVAPPGYDVGTYASVLPGGTP